MRLENFLEKNSAPVSVCNTIFFSSLSSYFFFTVCYSCIPGCSSVCILQFDVWTKRETFFCNRAPCVCVCVCVRMCVCVCVWSKICDLTLSHCLCVYSFCVHAYVCIWCSSSLRGRLGIIVSDCCWKDFCGSLPSVGWQNELLYDEPLMSGWSKRTLSALSFPLAPRVPMQESEFERRIWLIVSLRETVFNFTLYPHMKVSVKHYGTTWERREGGGADDHNYTL